MSSEEWSEKNVAEKGFTLIELLIVIAILGILAVVGILAFGGLRGKAQEAVDATELKTIETAVDAYIAGEGAVPANTTALVTDNYLKDSNLSCSYTIGGTVDAPTVTPTC